MYFVSEIGAETLEFSKNRRLPKTACFSYRTKRPARSQLFPVFVIILSIFIQKKGSWTAPILGKHRLLSVVSSISAAISAAVPVPRVVRWARVVVRRTRIKRIKRSWVIIRRIKWRSRARTRVVIWLSFIKR